jgi:D-tyrosyl-tRNA(Tyr) deacylase
MRAIVQRVSSASVSVDGEIVGQCGTGYLLLVGIATGDTDQNAVKLADRVRGVRLFNDADGRINLALTEVPGASVLAISNFTVYGDERKSRRPSFSQSAGFEEGKRLFDRFVAALRDLGVETQTGVFGADMQVSLVNDGPVTLVIDVDGA